MRMLINADQKCDTKGTERRARTLGEIGKHHLESKVGQDWLGVGDTLMMDECSGQ